MPKPTRIKSCKKDHCWLVAQDFSIYCKLHLKMVQSKGLALIQDLKVRLKDNWDNFIAMLRLKADSDDKEQVFMHDFKATLKFFRVKLTESQIDTLYNAFPGRKEGNRLRIRVGRFYDIKVAIERTGAYKKMLVKEQIETVQDASGYTGEMYRRKPQKAPEPMSETDFVHMVYKNNKTKEMIRFCREINEDKNGVVTVVELDDIIRMLYEEELEGRDLQALYEPFIHVNNKILISYKTFRDWIAQKVADLEALATDNQTTPKRSKVQNAFSKDTNVRDSIMKDIQNQNFNSQGVVAIKELLDQEKN